MQEQLSSTTTARDLGVKIQLTGAICGLKEGCWRIRLTFCFMRKSSEQLYERQLEP